jgi:hypothetical protein
MTMSKTTRRIFIVVVAVGAASLMLPGRRVPGGQAFAASRLGSESPGRYWLSQFEGGPVVVTFAEAPAGKHQVTECRLLVAESAGLVLRFPKETDKFFSYANIVSVDPK